MTDAEMSQPDYLERKFRQACTWSSFTIDRDNIDWTYQTFVRKYQANVICYQDIPNLCWWPVQTFIPMCLDCIYQLSRPIPHVSGRYNTYLFIILDEASRAKTVLRMNQSDVKCNNVLHVLHVHVQLRLINNNSNSINNHNNYEQNGCNTPSFLQRNKSCPTLLSNY